MCLQLRNVRHRAEGRFVVRENIELRVLQPRNNQGGEQKAQHFSSSNTVWRPPDHRQPPEALASEVNESAHAAPPHFPIEA